MEVSHSELRGNLWSRHTAIKAIVELRRSRALHRQRSARLRSRLGALVNFLNVTGR